MDRFTLLILSLSHHLLLYLDSHLLAFRIQCLYLVVNQMPRRPSLRDINVSGTFLPFPYPWFSSVQSFSHIWLFVTPWTAAHQASLSVTNSHSLLKLLSVRPYNHLILCHPLLLLPSIFPSIRVFSNEQVLCIRWPKVLEFQLQHQSFQWIFRTDFL